MGLRATCTHSLSPLLFVVGKKYFDDGGSIEPLLLLLHVKSRLFTKIVKSRLPTNQRLVPIHVKIIILKFGPINLKLSLKIGLYEVNLIYAALL